MPERLTLWATTGRPARLGVLAMALTLAALGFVGCSDSGDDDAVQSTTTTESTTTTTAPEETDADEVVAAFEDAVFAVLRAATVPDPDDPNIERTHTGPMLEQARDVLRGYKLRRIVLRYPEPLESGFEVSVDPGTVELTVDTAVFEACTVDRGERVNSETGEVISSNSDAGPVYMRVGMRLVDGTWKLAERRNLDSPAGGEECAA